MNGRFFHVNGRAMFRRTRLLFLFDFINIGIKSESKIFQQVPCESVKYPDF